MQDVTPARAPARAKRVEKLFVEKQELKLRMIIYREFKFQRV